MLKEKRLNENGRSMVEMLGVLAIIGVLSVTGIAGYTIAMNKHKANELMHQVFIRVSSCMAQIVRGETVLSIEDFGTYDGYTFTPSYDTANKTLSIQISGKAISDSVCNNIKNNVGSNVTFAPDICQPSNSFIVLTYTDETGNTANDSGPYNCVDKGDCVDTELGPECPYGGQYPDKCLSKPDCFGKTCYCNPIENTYGCDCINGGTYPDNCNVVQCLLDNTCGPSWEGPYVTCKEGYTCIEADGEEKCHDCILTPSCVASGTCHLDGSSWACNSSSETYPECTKNSDPVEPAEPAEPDCSCWSQQYDVGNCWVSEGECWCDSSDNFPYCS